MAKIYAGNQTFVSGHREGPYCNAIIGLILLALEYDNVEWKLRAPSYDLGMRTNRGTTNHRFLYRVFLYLWAMGYGTEAEKADARKVLLQYFQDQLTGGHMEGEFWTTSHGQLHYLAIYGARFGARWYKDREMLAATGRYLRGDMGLMDLVVDSDGQINTPNARPALADAKSKATPSNFPLRNVIYHMQKGRQAESVMRLKEPDKPVIGPSTPGDPGAALRWWRDVYNFPALLLKWLIDRGDDLGGVMRGITEIPPVRNTVIIDKAPSGDYVIQVPHWTKSGPHILPWTARINGKRQDAPVWLHTAAEWDSEPPAPKLPDAERVVIKGVRS